jgi:hypothetical protein
MVMRERYERYERYRVIDSVGGGVESGRWGARGGR